MYLNNIDQVDWLNFDFEYHLTGMNFPINLPINFLTVTGDNTNNPITGTDADDVLNGEGGADFLDGGLGNDELNGGDGSDFLVGGDGDDMLFGGAGDDDLIGSVGDDRIYGGDGDDFIVETLDGVDVENDRDFIDAGAGDDIIEDFSGRDIVFAGAGDDEINVSFFDTGIDFYNGGAGIDTVTYQGRYFTDFVITQDARGVVTLVDENGVRDVLNRVEFIQFDDITIDLLQPLPTVIQLGQDGGTFFSDAAGSFVLGGAGNDVINGSTGDDRITGGAGDDQLNLAGGNTQTANGGEGNDLITASGIVDYLDGGAGNDTIIATSLVAIVTDEGGVDLIDLSAVTISFVIAFGEDVSNDFYIGGGAVGGGSSQLIYFDTSIFDVTFGEDGNGDLTITQESGAVDTVSNFSDVRFISETGEDITIDGTSGLPDIIYAQAGVNTTATHLDDLVLGTEGKDVITGAAGNDSLYGYLGNDQIFGRTGDDEIFGGDGRDALNGGAGNDTLSGGAGNDLLIGQNGMDILIDGAGDDVLRGGNDDDTFQTMSFDSGNDFFSGGNGVDIVVYSDGFQQEAFTFSLNNQGRLSVTDIFGHTDTLANVELLEIDGNLIDVALLVSSLQGGNSMTLSDFEGFTPSDNTASELSESSFLADFSAIELELFTDIFADVDVPDFDLWV